MDRITRSYLNDFKSDNKIDEDDDARLFEHMVNYTIAERYAEESYEIESLNVGGGGTIGIDGFIILLNHQVIQNEDELNDFIDQHKKCSAIVVFIQTKTSPKFELKEIGNFEFAIQDFISEKQKLKWSDTAKPSIKMLNRLIERTSELRDNPACYMFYVTLGKNGNDQNIEVKRESIEKTIGDEGIFSSVKFELFGASEIQSEYKKIGQSHEVTINFESKIVLPELGGVDESYIGIVDASTIVKMMTNESGGILSSIFYDNVRDYQGSNNVNIEISNTLSSEGKDAFVILNNGITVVAEKLSVTRNLMTISNYQIINGCQTSHVLFENRNILTNDVKVPLKLIVSSDQDLISKVIRSTNRQTEVKEQDLIAYTNFQKKLEDYYASFPEPCRLYYERRSKQYKNKGIDHKKIVDKTMQIKAVASMFFNKPDMATRYFGALFNEFKDSLFKDGHEMEPYYTATYSMFKIECLFKKGVINNKYRKIKYHILMMLRHELNPQKCFPFESKKSKQYCENILLYVNDEIKFLDTINRVISKIDHIGPNLDNELSKSRDFVKNCLDAYNSQRNDLVL